MRKLEDQLAAYATYHRDARNIVTHFIGIPMIVISLLVLLSRPSLGDFVLPLSPALVVVVVLAIYYLRLSVSLGSIMVLLLACFAWFGAWAASLSTAWWLTLGLGGFVIGWIFQFIGHFWEGRKPAFMDDLAGLIIGPLFVLAEACFLAGGFRELALSIEARAGKVRNGRKWL
ncbi:Mpo1 family 2-hydroxy fatty acid dioxygenase [Serratia entomophila]|uniref:Mpo1 family 2-hydroxy fatty acid dioxygenase n=1 Tax=Serratia entomophila TaxID=42906 RepID=UPI00217B0AB9|nr:Mpo1-like protein [Serratia entomophila]CAI1059437.1 Protein of uncharacterised function (DUF962) [Serratia entomophila]CAI1063357.1 Protein of uncharacterised function (DUF962) [Serratia entomophila]CAI1115193.1 Protein of uncharacterised function (DUF962) [Serratia entomophila]CAI1889783.1 Protein of uncharacterised function (DUF962) [Serratia entomophila]CAI1916758.1 Protein of uncharacterised function (DUF962) [Serratia entomophila]